MATECSSMLVAVRVRPFTGKEDAACCTIVVPDNTTISVFDIPSLIPSSTACGPAAGGVPGCANSNDSGVSNASVTPGLVCNTSCLTGAGKGMGFNTAGNIDSLQHSYSFDKIFWSVSPAVLPFPPLSMLDAVVGDDIGVGSESRRKTIVSSAARPTKAQHNLLSQYAAVAKHLPCFAPAPTYDDQQRVYDFIGPRMCEAAMSGFNTCLLAYGQTGSGKSYSIIGPTDAFSVVSSAAVLSSGKLSHSIPARQRGNLTSVVTVEQGIMPRLCSDLFRLMREEREMDEGVTHSVELSLLEIYCEKVRDLLTVSSLGTPSSNSSTVGAPASVGGSLRIRQHPSQGPYVEGLSHVKVRDADGVLKYLISGLRDRATAGTSMNEHSSRSHAILQLHITKVMADTDEHTSNVVTRTRTCKVNMVDLAGSERVSQSGVSGDRFEEAKNINLSLSTLGRVIQQLSEKQAGKNVIPAYRDSVLTWLLSDSLGGNSKTIMLATVSPSAYCYQQTLNTLRFAGVAKKVVNIATVNEDCHFQQLIAELRRQIVGLTLELESGKAAEVHLEKINSLRQEREALLAENDALKVKVISAADTTVLRSLRKRVKDLEAENAQLRGKAQTLQERMLTSTGTLRDELAQQRAEVMKLHEALSGREAEVTDWANRYRALVITTTTPSTKTLSAGSGVQPVASTADVKAEQKRLQEELKQAKTKLQKVTQDLSAAEHARQEAVDAAKTISMELDEYRARYEESKRQLDLMHERMQSTMSLLETAQCELSAIKSHSTSELAKTRAVEDALEATSAASAIAAAHLEQVRSDYLEEKQRNVQLLLRLAQVEQERSALKRSLVQRDSDIGELEQLLLEETETSERYYLRMRYFRYVQEIQCQCMVQLLHLRDMADSRRGSQGMPGSASIPTGNASNFSSTPRIDNDTGCQNTFTVAARPLYHDPSTTSSHTAGAAHEASFSARLLHMQLVYECQCDESRMRATVEQEYTDDIARLLSQKLRLCQITTAGVSAKLAEVEDAHKSLHELLQYYMQRAKAQEEEYAEEVAQHQRDSNVLHVAEVDRMRLERKVSALEDVNIELETGRNSLITKVAQLQDQLSMWQGRCTEAEKIAIEVQNLLFPGTPASALSSPAATGTVEGDIARRDTSLRRRTYPALTSKVQEAQDAMEAKPTLENQRGEYRVELGVLRVQVGQMELEKQAVPQQATRNDRTQQQAETCLRQANAQLMQEISTITRDYESRIRQQQTMMNTLRHALDEETAMADLCRQSVQRAEAARKAQEEELIAAREAAEELLRQREAMSSKYLEVQTELDELQTHYHHLERRLLELREREPELCVLLEKGLGEDPTDWLEKVHHEKMRLVKQRFEARRLNSELLEHVQDRKTRLRNVQQQLAAACIGGRSPEEIHKSNPRDPHTSANADVDKDVEELG
ncbi:hypothetical protein JKF63_04416 [Porcisia hertigi]|uniref:Kinesin motor domain-containing protein n=1 Tax=Porcisia hertigi TaxID=2761500 RepID=A0A836I8S1_9TRYP|nr:hypothetical protein JKF63_04416 [Porcisia hertigi]